MAVDIKIQFNGKSLTIPINPEELNMIRSADNEDIDIIGIGPVSRKGAPGLYKIVIESFFPGEKSYFYTGVKPTTCVEFIDTIWKTENNNNNVAKLITTGLQKNINMYFVIENFEWDYKAGEEEDIYYNLEIKEYVPYGVKTIPWKLVNETKKAVSSSSATRTSSTSTTSTKNTYKVQKGDCLWNIAKSASGSGSNWKQLYNLNKKVIGSNPNLIKPGQILTLPDGWKGNFKTSKLSNSKKKTSSSKTKSKTSSNTKVSNNTNNAKNTTSSSNNVSYASKGGGVGSKGSNLKLVLQAKPNASTRVVTYSVQKTLIKQSSGKSGGFR